MLIACWSVKGGSGTTVVAAALAMVLGRSAPGGSVVADLGGDIPTVLGMSESSGPGLSEWLAAGPTVAADALSRLALPGPGSVSVLPWGSAPLDSPSAGRAEVLAAVLATERRPVVVDCGPGLTSAGLAMAAAASESLLVIRPCYIALKRARAAPLQPSGVVLVDEPGRSLGRRDVEDVLGVPVRAVVAVDPAVARAVDSGLFARRLPRSLDRALRHAA